MKKLTTIMAGLVLAAGVHAQQYQTTAFALTNALAANATNSTIGATNTVSGGHTVGVAIHNVNKYEDVGIQVSAKLDAAGTELAKFAFARSVNGVVYETANSNMLVMVTGLGTLTATTVSNFNVGAASFIKLVAVCNGNDQIMTNIVVTYSTKPQRFGK